MLAPVSAQRSQRAGDHHECPGEQANTGSDLPFMAGEPVHEPLERLFGVVLGIRIEDGGRKACRQASGLVSGIVVDRWLGLIRPRPARSGLGAAAQQALTALHEPATP